MRKGRFDENAQSIAQGWISERDDLCRSKTPAPGPPVYFAVVRNSIARKSRNG